MSIQVVKHVNKDEDNRIEYLFVNFDYYDGNDLVASFFCQEYQMLSDEKIDGMHYSIIKLHDVQIEYDLIWHEDVGNYIFCLTQDEASISELVHRIIINWLYLHLILCQPIQLLPDLFHRACMSNGKLQAPC